MTFAGLLAYFLTRVQRGEAAAAPAAALGVFFLTSTAMYAECASQVHTQLPGMALTLLGSLCLLGDRPRPVAAGLLLASASAFRIQVAFIGPAWVALLFATYGWSAGRGPAVRLTLAAGLAAAAFHGALALAEPNYLECIIHSHVRRAPTPPGEKYAVLTGLFQEPQVAVGLVAAALLAAGPRGPARGLGVFVVAETLLTLAGSRFLGTGYFLAIYPYLAGCGAIVLSRAAAQVGPWRPLLAVAIAVTVLAGVPIAGTTAYRWTTQRAFERDLIARVRAVPGRTVACTPAKVALFAMFLRPLGFH